jgi:MtN3 and saliva related transmembrane protein
MNADWVGDIAGILTTLAFIPQVIRVWQRQSAADISPVTFGAIVAGTALWAVYGVMINAMPTIIANVVTCVLASSLLILKRHLHLKSLADQPAG